MRLKNKNPNLVLSVPVLLFKIQPEDHINPFTVAQDSEMHSVFLLESTSGTFFRQGVLFWFYSTRKMCFISLCNCLAFLKDIVEVIVLEVTLLCCFFGAGDAHGASPALLPHNHRNPKPQPNTGLK